MQMSSIPVPEVYREESADFRFFQKWFELSLSKLQYDTEEFFDLFDPLRCPQDLLWLLGETMGYRYDDRMSAAFNRLVLVYFMNMIRLKGSRDGVTLAAQVNLTQFKLQDLASENSMLNNRLEDTTLPSNSVYVQSHPDEGYIDVVYFSDRIPVDTCLEYARPAGMYLVPHAGVRYDAKDKLCIDSRLTDKDDTISLGSTHVGDYNVEDYSRIQQYVSSNDSYELASRDPAWYRNSKYEDITGMGASINAGYRALSSLQLSNSDTTTRSLLHGRSSLNDISENDVSVFDDSTGRVYTQSDFEQQYHRFDPVAYVPTEPMGIMGQAMVSDFTDETKTHPDS